MKLHKVGNFTFALDLSCTRVDLILLVGYGSRRVRIDIGREEVRDGWQVRVSKIKAWKKFEYGIYVTSHLYFSKEFIH